MLSTNLRTTLAGALGALGLYLTSVKDPPWLAGVGVALQALGTFLLGLFARDAGAAGGDVRPPPSAPASPAPAPAPASPPQASTTATAIVVGLFTLALALASCTAAQRAAATAAVDAAAPACPVVAVLSGSQLAGVVCTDVAELLEHVLEATPTPRVAAVSLAGPARPCELVAVRHDGRPLGHVCAAHAPALLAALAARDAGAP